MLDNSCSFTGRLIPRSNGYHLETTENRYATRTTVPLHLPPHHAESVDALFDASYAATVTGYMQNDTEGALYLYVTDIDIHGFSERIADLIREQ